MEQEEETRLIERVLAGERDLFAALVAEHAPRLFRLALALCGSRAEAEDVVQESFLKGYAALAAFRTEQRLRPWLYAICLNCSRRRLGVRARGAWREVSLEDAPDVGDPQPGPEEWTQSREARERLRLGLLRLPLELREALALRYVNELPFHEVAAIVGVNAETAKMRVYRGLAKLRLLLPKDMR